VHEVFSSNSGQAAVGIEMYHRPGVADFQKKIHCRFAYDT
jgi:hypothetical protein